MPAAKPSFRSGPQIMALAQVWLELLKKPVLTCSLACFAATGTQERSAVPSLTEAHRAMQPQRPAHKVFAVCNCTSGCIYGQQWLSSRRPAAPLERDVNNGALEQQFLLRNRPLHQVRGLRREKRLQCLLARRSRAGRGTQTREDLKSRSPNLGP